MSRARAQMGAGDSTLALGNPGRQCVLVIGLFRAVAGSESGASSPRPPGQDELVTRLWPGCPAPGREPGCPEMSSGSLGGIHHLFLACGLLWGLAAPQGLASSETHPHVGPRGQAFFGLANENTQQALNT